MDIQDKLWDAFGELIYCVAMTDGVVQKEEITTLENILQKHSWAKEIKWSFDYEISKNNSIDFLYKKVLDICHEYGPSAEYQFLIEILTQVAEASNGIDKDEENLIKNFTRDLTERFSNDLDKMKLNK